MVDRKEIVRAVIEQIEVQVIGNSERVRVVITWAGGHRTEGVMIRPVARLEQLSTYPALCARVQDLYREGNSPAGIARVLDGEGFKPPKRFDRFGKHGVTGILRTLGLITPKPQQRRPLKLGTNEWSLTGLATALGMNRCTLYTWIDRGWVKAAQQPGLRGRWIVWADDAELDRLRERYRRNCEHRSSVWKESQRDA